ncbi:unnamed protein product [Orchesella dallaii]|uniref:Uncharacterized protein n=1 Tax=Orchesella dallaii TaxID=48710 RepID=A0ABP1R032_9HEXA
MVIHRCPLPPVRGPLPPVRCPPVGEPLVDETTNKFIHYQPVGCPPVGDTHFLAVRCPPVALVTLAVSSTSGFHPPVGNRSLESGSPTSGQRTARKWVTHRLATDR